MGQYISLQLFYFVNLTSSFSLMPWKKNKQKHIGEVAPKPDLSQFSPKPDLIQAAPHPT